MEPTQASTDTHKDTIQPDSIPINQFISSSSSPSFSITAPQSQQQETSSFDLEQAYRLNDTKDEPKLRRQHSCCIHKQEMKAGLLDPSPSPIVYNVKYLSIGAGHPKSGYSFASRPSTTCEETPSPAAYNIGMEVGDGSPSWTMAFKPQKPLEPSPGPGDYSPEFLKWKMSTSPSFSMRCKTGPPIFFTKETTPSCNAYFPQLEKSKKSASLKGRYKESKSLKTPGPSSYLISNDSTSGPQFSMVGKGEEPEPIFVPGPSSYTPKPHFILHRSPTVVLATRLNPIKTLPTSPGPIYKPTINTFEHQSGPKVTLKSRHSLEPKTITPGPADYNTSPSNLHDRWTPSSSTTPPLPRSSKPSSFPSKLHPTSSLSSSSSSSSSPTSSTPPSLSLPHASTSGSSPTATTTTTTMIPPVSPSLPTPPASTTPPTHASLPLKSKSSQPGPADYTITSASKWVRPQPPGFSLRPRLASKCMDSGPAPNAYSIQFKQQGKQVSMKGKFNEHVLVFPSLRQNTLKV